MPYGEDGFLLFRHLHMAKMSFWSSSHGDDGFVVIIIWPCWVFWHHRVAMMGFLSSSRDDDGFFVGVVW